LISAAEPPPNEAITAGRRRWRPKKIAAASKFVKSEFCSPMNHPDDSLSQSVLQRDIMHNTVNQDYNNNGRSIALVEDEIAEKVENHGSSLFPSWMP
jgi:hypothetical protein